MNSKINIWTIVKTLVISCLAMFSIITSGFAGSHAMKPAVIYDIVVSLTSPLTKVFGMV